MKVEKANSQPLPVAINVDKLVGSVRIFANEPTDRDKINIDFDSMVDNLNITVLTPQEWERQVQRMPRIGEEIRDVISQYLLMALASPEMTDILERYQLTLAEPKIHENSIVP
jgi:hypothetical protein